MQRLILAEKGVATNQCCAFLPWTEFFNAISQKRTFIRALEVQSQVIGWLWKGRDSNGGGTLLQFP